jgi:hypothetical protein
MKKLSKTILVLLAMLFTQTIMAECTSVIRYINGVWNKNAGTSHEVTKKLTYLMRGVFMWINKNYFCFCVV